MRKPAQTKAYYCVVMTGYNLKKQPVYSSFAVNATDWQQARIKSRKQAILNGQKWVSIRVSKLGGTADLFTAPPIQKPARILKLDKHIGQTVVFDYIDLTGYKGTFWGTLESVTTDGTPVIQTGAGYYSPNPKHVTATR